MRSGQQLFRRFIWASLFGQSMRTGQQWQQQRAPSFSCRTILEQNALLRDPAAAA